MASFLNNPKEIANLSQCPLHLSLFISFQFIMHKFVFGLISDLPSVFSRQIRPKTKLKNNEQTMVRASSSHQAYQNEIAKVSIQVDPHLTSSRAKVWTRKPSFRSIDQQGLQFCKPEPAITNELITSTFMVSANTMTTRDKANKTHLLGIGESL